LLGQKLFQVFLIKMTNLNAPKKQQIEGLKFVLQQVSFPVFIRAIRNLKKEKCITKSYYYRLVKRARKILNISYKDYLRIK
jgi:hypothetical protein